MCPQWLPTIYAFDGEMIAIKEFSVDFLRIQIYIFWVNLGVYKRLEDCGIGWESIGQ